LAIIAADFLEPGSASLPATRCCRSMSNRQSSIPAQARQPANAKADDKLSIGNVSNHIKG